MLDPQVSIVISRACYRETCAAGSGSDFEFYAADAQNADVKEANGIDSRQGLRDSDRQDMQSLCRNLDK